MGIIVARWKRHSKCVNLRSNAPNILHTDIEELCAEGGNYHVFCCKTFVWNTLEWNGSSLRYSFV